MRSILCSSGFEQRLQRRLRHHVHRLLGHRLAPGPHHAVETVVDASVSLAADAARRLILGANTDLTTSAVESKYDELAGRVLKHRIGDEGGASVYWIDGSLQRVSPASFDAAMLDEQAAHLRPLSARSLLEVGAGELTALAGIGRRLPHATCLHGIDLSFPRIYQGATYFRDRQPILIAAKANALHLPYPDHCFDVVYTSHCLEHIPLGFRQAIDEMIRVARRAVVLFEPSYELTGPVQKLRMRAHGYLRGLSPYLSALPHDTPDPTLLKNAPAFNRTACHIIELMADKELPMPSLEPPDFACPTCHRIVTNRQNTHICETCQKAYPIIDAVPVLDPDYAYDIQPPPTAS